MKKKRIFFYSVEGTKIPRIQTTLYITHIALRGASNFHLKGQLVFKISHVNFFLKHLNYSDYNPKVRYLYALKCYIN